MFRLPLKDGILPDQGSQAQHGAPQQHTITGSLSDEMSLTACHISHVEGETPALGLASCRPQGCAVPGAPSCSRTGGPGAARQPDPRPAPWYPEAQSEAGVAAPLRLGGGACSTRDIAVQRGRQELPGQGRHCGKDRPRGPVCQGPAGTERPACRSCLRHPLGPGRDTPTAGSRHRGPPSPQLGRAGASSGLLGLRRDYRTSWRDGKAERPRCSAAPRRPSSHGAQRSRRCAR